MIGTTSAARAIEVPPSTDLGRLGESGRHCRMLSGPDLVGATPSGEPRLKLGLAVEGRAAPHEERVRCEGSDLRACGVPDRCPRRKRQSRHDRVAGEALLARRVGPRARKLPAPLPLGQALALFALPAL